MSDEEEAGTRAAPKFVPTLTEVVAPGQAPASATSPGMQAAQPGAPASATSARSLDADVLAQAVLAQIGPDLHMQIAAAMGRLLHEQLLGFNARVQKAVSEVVHDAVAKAMAQSAHGTDDGKTP